MLVEVKGVQFQNQGAHLMLLAVLERLRLLVPGARIVLTAGPESPVERIEQLGALRKLRLRKRWLDANVLGYAWPDSVSAALVRRGRAAEGQVDAVLDASGFAYGGDWTPWLMTYAADEVRRKAARGQPYIFLPQAFGPFPASRAATDFGAALEHAAMICVRDARSQRFLAELNPRLAARLERFPDVTIGLRGDPAAAQRWAVDQQTILLIPNWQMTGERNPDAEWREGYLRFLVDLVGHIRQQGREPVLLNHEGRGDAALCEQVAAAKPGVRIIAEPDPPAVKAVIGAASAVVSSRYHGCLAALSQGVPCIATSWSHKYQELYAEFDVPHWVLEHCDAAEAAARLAASLADRRSHSQQLLEHSARQEAEVARLWQRVGELLRSAQTTGPRP
jgi:colanic acid/amylovoran biosynthesis protein